MLRKEGNIAIAKVRKAIMVLHRFLFLFFFSLPSLLFIATHSLTWRLSDSEFCKDCKSLFVVKAVNRRTKEDRNFIKESHERNRNF